MKPTCVSNRQKCIRSGGTLSRQSGYVMCKLYVFQEKNPCIDESTGEQKKCCVTKKISFNGPTKHQVNYMCGTLYDYDYNSGYNYNYSSSYDYDYNY